MEKVLVIGSNGMLGYAVSEYFASKNYNVVKLSRNDFDIGIEPHENFLKFLDGIDLVINCAGLIKPTIGNFPIEQAIRVNSIFPRNIALMTKARNIKCFHITTDCVYSGKKGNYNELDLFDANDLYGMTKNAGENKDCMVLRTSIIGEEKNNSRSLLEWAKSQKGKEVNGFTNHLWNGVTTLYLAEVIENILKNNLYKEGIFHIHSPNTVNKFELLNLFNDIYQLNYLKINQVEAKDKIDRTLSSVYDLTNNVCTKKLEEQISEMKNFFEVKINRL
ncbi:MAG: SDR family oxidoreductase [Melioribacteraceae bacterium]|nr:SDR family oxidoreductase [Melioribacteraceae bacterium]